MSEPAPVNHTKQDNSPAAIAETVAYVTHVANAFAAWWRRHGPDHVKQAERPFAGVDVLELGPGATLGSAVLLACAGARVSVADRFVPRWDSDFHTPFYEALLRRIEEAPGPYDAAPMRRLLGSRSFVPDIVACHTAAGEELYRIGTRFDVVLSNAVLEHVQNLAVTARNLAAVTRPGGYNFHQVDFRDHESFERPLEFLTMSRAAYEPVREAGFCERGAQWRVSTVTGALTAAGFTVTSSVNKQADPDYLASVRPRLHPEFAHLSDDDLIGISAFFVARRNRP